ncbi:selenium-binding protein SBP56-related protein [Streptosporangium roseum]|uniref:Selenium-binding protein n=1 Tax=Streptosporangium roseum (strain ATCC 12428 / DSM 43021 / JCM 3005 / KCTC 9067 / NCIMB 10171 / NRRL 2505 / NI 9100) TaxID=479432 RepID=D2BAT0_STRRD|nr:selenium-binding protein SBP56-related protein [Streptosporangium roseum]ACZ89910.1 selenium-binding protein [Streptosporangium roseum DSM 43021]
MALIQPDPTFYPSAREAMLAPREELAYVALLDTAGDGRPDGLATIDLSDGSIVNVHDMSVPGDELHHFGWNVCSAALCPYAPHPHVERRYLVLPGLRSSRIYIFDVKDDPWHPKLVKTIEPETIFEKTGYSRPHTVHCGTDAIYVSALGNVDGDAPGGVFTLDHDTFEPKGRWEADRGTQELHYDFWWHLGHDTMISSEWGTPNQIEPGPSLDLLVGREYGHKLHVWDLSKRRHLQEIDLGDQHQMALELRPAHDPTKTYGFVNTVISVEDLSANIFTWYLEDGVWKARKTITIPAEPAPADLLPAPLKQFGAVPPLVSDISLTLDDRILLVSCWGTGELKAYDVSDPFAPRETGSVRIGGIAQRGAHPAAPERALNGGPQMVEASRDGRRVYFTNSLYRSWDDVFYPDGISSWMAKVDIADDGSISLDPGFFVDFASDGRRAHQIRLQGGDSSSDSYCFP